MPREPLYPGQDTHLELLRAGGYELVHDTRTTDITEVTELLRAATLFGYGVEVVSYERQDVLDVEATFEMEWWVTMWRYPALLGHDRESALRASGATTGAYPHVARAAEPVEQGAAAETVMIVCPGVGEPPAGPGDLASMGRCSGCDRSNLALRLDDMITRHCKHVPADGPEGKLTPWVGAAKTRPTRGTRRTSAPAASQATTGVPPSRVRRVRVVCPGSNQSVRITAGVKPRCAGCERDNLKVKRYSPTAAVGFLPRHTKRVDADSEEASTGRPW